MIIKRAYLQKEKDQAAELLKTKQLGFDDDIDTTFYIEENNTVAATLSTAGNVIKAVAVDGKFQGQNLTAVLVNHALQYLHGKGIWKVFVFTKPENTEIFSSLSFSLISQTDRAALLENSETGIEKQLAKLAKTLPPCENRSCIVANLNPITVGHKFLISHAASHSEQLIVFLVEENKSAFDFSFRYDLAVNELKDLKNVFIVPSTQYLISNATFPSYFLKEGSDVDEIYSELDAKIFHSFFVPAFNVKRRFVGTEPYCPTTSKYNAALKKEMSGLIEVVERLKEGGEEVSASRVRKLLKQNKWEQLKPLVGEYTYNCLLKYAK